MPTIDYMDCFRTGPDTIAGKYMRKFWHPVFRAEDLKPGWAKPIRIMGEDFTFIAAKAADRKSSTFAAPTANRTLSVGWVEGDCIRCRFHGWKFDSSGQCVEQPAEKKPLPRKFGSAAVPRKNISDSYSSTSATASSSLAPLSGFRERGLVGGDLRSSLQFP